MLLNQNQFIYLGLTKNTHMTLSSDSRIAIHIKKKKKSNK